MGNLENSEKNGNPQLKSGINEKKESEKSPEKKFEKKQEKEIIAKGKLGKELKFILENGLHFEIESNQDRINVSNTKQIILPSMVSIKTDELLGDSGEILESRIPIDLICVIDHSGSMAGKKESISKRNSNRIIRPIK